MVRRLLIGGTLAAVAGAAACSTETIAGPGSGQGMLAVRLTDSPVPFDSVAAVNVFVVRVEARRRRTESDSVLQANMDEDNWVHESDSTESDSTEHEMGDDGEHEWGGSHPDSAAWVTIAEPNQTFNLLDLQDGISAFLGSTPIDTGTFKGIRLVIDPAQSSVVRRT